MTPAERTVAIASLLLALSPTAARAQSAEAEVLFRDGRTLIKAGKLAEGCGKIAASERIESSVGTLLNLGDCRDKQGKPASAWAAFKKAEATARHAGNDDKRGDEAHRRAVALEPLLSTITLEVPSPTPGLVVKRDGEVVDVALYGTAVPLDPGTYQLSAEAPGFTAWHSEIVLTFKTRRRIAVPALVPAKGTERRVVAPPDLPVAMTPVAAPPVVVVRARSRWTPWRKFSAVLAVGGTAAVGTGLYFGWRASDLERDADRRCPLAVCTDSQALKDNNRARDFATAANVLYVAGGVAVASAIAIWFVASPNETVVAPAVGNGMAGAAIAGRF